MKKNNLKFVLVFIFSLTLINVYAADVNYLSPPPTHKIIYNPLSQFNNNNNPFFNAYLNHRLLIQAEYLYWEVKASPKVIPLVDSGTLEHPATELVMGGKRINQGWRPGGRFNIEYLLNDACDLRAQANYFFLSSKSRSQSVDSSGLIGSPYLTIPFFDVTIPGNNSTDLSLPGFSSGTATFKTSNRMQGAELNLLKTVYAQPHMDLALLAGFRYWNFYDDVSFLTSTPSILHFEIFKTADRFQAKNNFYGGQLGARFDYRCDKAFLQINGKVALGAMRSQADISGILATTLYSNSATIQYFNGGYFALPTNIGKHSRTRFSTLPEVDINLGYAVTNHLSLVFGYNFLYVTNMLWAANEMNNRINPTQAPSISGSPSTTVIGPAEPSAKMKSDSLWVQGFNAGLVYNF